MGPLDAIKTGFAKSFQFKGRAARAEFWWFALLFVGGGFGSFWSVEALLPRTLGPFENPAATTMLIFLAISALPFLSVGVRRFHDVGLHGVLFLIPVMVLAVGICVSFYDSTVANPGIEYAGLGGAILAYGGFLVTAPFVLLACTLKSRSSSDKTNHNLHEVPQ